MKPFLIPKPRSLGCTWLTLSSPEIWVAIREFREKQREDQNLSQGSVAYNSTINLRLLYDTQKLAVR